MAEVISGHRAASAGLSNCHVGPPYGTLTSSRIPSATPVSNADESL
jgi:hypothetical protein